MKVKVVSKDNYGAIKKIGRAFRIAEGGSADICIAIGGDGTFIQAARQFDGPILPIRTNEPGSAGFYADVPIDKIDRVISLLKAGSYRVEELSRRISVEHDGHSSYAVNEVALKSTDEEVYFSIYGLDKKGKRTRFYPFIMAGDGMLATSAVGSYAYNRSANGPIMMTDKVMCLTFLNPDGPYKNPIIVDADRRIEVVVEKWQGQLKCDNKVVATLKRGDRFKVGLSGKRLDIIRLDGFSETMDSKLRRLITRKMTDRV